MKLKTEGASNGAILAALYNHSQPQGMGFAHFDPKPMTVEEADAIIAGGQSYFDYHKGRVMKVAIGGDVLDARLYDRDNGTGAAYTALQAAGITATIHEE